MQNQQPINQLSGTNSVHVHSYRSHQPRPPQFQPQSIPPKNSRRPVVPILVTAVICCLIISIGSLSVAVYVLINQPDTVTVQHHTTDGNSATFDSVSIESVVNQVSPSVVSIVGTVGRTGLFGGSSQSAGTGIIVSSNGYILTNKHVVEGVTQSSLSVVTHYGDTFDDIELVGVDPLNDIAFLKIRSNRDDFPYATLGSSRTISVGQPVIAIGNALGQYQNTVTAGIISGMGRTVVAADGAGRTETLTDLIQTDTAINPGNSGGPLVNAAGEVIGINTAVATESQNIGFAIPIGAVKGMLAGVLENHRVERPFIGVQFITITPDVAIRFDLAREGYPIRRGAYIFNERGGSAVASGSPADRAGLRDRDIITHVNGIEVGPAGSVATLAAEHSVGTTIQLTVLRGTQELTIPVTLGAFSQ
ncbi:trypsin-like peptidase domain-containing protein [Candidatus Saccharibacteria bacterium]|nr:trypsin-like peptidase domain-containing protein [Candidatus Saccharibacteria bacterium]